ncbi:Nucleic acid-binding, OB-fold [Sesbania bispinosa]|nr:Nucleic acid-binding, OB-fold [Sesbania bispinosa]
MAGVYDLIKEVYPGRQNWRLKARIIRLWEMCPMEQPGNPFAIKMVMIDARAGSSKLPFGFQSPCMALSLMTTEDIKNTGGRSDYLIDFMGILFAVSSEKTSDRSGRTTRFIVMELNDDKGMIRCTMFGEYVDAINVHLAEAGDELPVVVVQLGRVKTYKGDITIQNVVNTTKIILNPNIPEVQTFKNRLTLNGFEIEASIGEIGEGYKELPLKDDFLGFFFPRKTILKLHVTEEFLLAGGQLHNFIVLGTIAAVLKDDQWWYYACRCMKAVNEDGGEYFCPACCINVDHVTPSLLSCADLLAEAKVGFVETFGAKRSDPEFGDHPPEFGSIVGRELLFKVDKGSGHAFRFDDTFRVRRICDDPSIIGIFKDNSVVKTPEKSVFIPPFPNLDGASSNGVGRVEVHEVVDVSCELDPESLNLEEITIENKGDGHQEKIQAGETNLKKKKKNLRLKKVKIERD